jgi:hypothetical protein
MKTLLAKEALLLLAGICDTAKTSFTCRQKSTPSVRSEKSTESLLPYDVSKLRVGVSVSELGVHMS